MELHHILEAAEKLVQEARGSFDLDLPEQCQERLMALSNFLKLELQREEKPEPAPAEQPAHQPELFKSP